MMRKKILASERGAVLVISLLTISLLIAAGAAAIIAVQSDLKIAANLAAGNRAFYIAEAGINHARRELQAKDSTMSFDRAMQAGPGAVLAANLSFNGGSYKVVRLEAALNPDRIRARSTASAPNNAVSEVEVWFRKIAGRPPKAVTSGGDLRISGSPRLVGSCGGAHANDDMQIAGSPSVQMIDGLTSSNINHAGGIIPEGMEITGTPDIAAEKLDAAEKRDAYEASHGILDPSDIPAVNPADYAPHVASLGASGKGYVLHDDGTVTTGPEVSCAPNGLCSGGSATTVPQGWSFSDGTWKVAGAEAADGVFYAEGKIEISGNVGSAALPWQATLIARDDIRIASDIHVRPFPTASAALQNQLFVAGNDLDINGNVTAKYAPGSVLVHQQFRITKDLQLAGFLIAGDGQPSWPDDPFPDGSAGIALSEISGSPVIDYSCQFGCSGPACPAPEIALLGWKQNF